MSAWGPGATVECLRRRSERLGLIRDYFKQRAVFEVQTPILAHDTVTEPDIASIAVPGYGYLQTSPEYHMKRLLAAGMPDCYQLGPVFRQDERGRLHRSEFTLLEWYRLGMDHLQLMEEVADLVNQILGVAPFERVSYGSLVSDLSQPREHLDLAFAEAIDALPDGRFFITDYPSDQAALARLSSAQDVAARFELVVNGVEIANGYWELRDAGEHRRRFNRDRERRRLRGLPDIEMDSLFLSALDSGLPNCAGVALGVDRLLMLAEGESSIEAVMAFASDDK